MKFCKQNLLGMPQVLIVLVVDLWHPSQILLAKFARDAVGTEHIARMCRRY